MRNDCSVYAISGRIKNILAREDIALSQVGSVLVNYFTLMLKELYDFSGTLPVQDREKLDSFLEKCGIYPNDHHSSCKKVL